MSPEVFEQLWKEAERRDPKGQVCVGVCVGRRRIDSSSPSLSGERGVFPCADGGGASTPAATRPTSPGRTHGILQLVQGQRKWGALHTTYFSHLFNKSLYSAILDNFCPYIVESYLCTHITTCAILYPCHYIHVASAYNEKVLLRTMSR